MADTYALPQEEPVAKSPALSGQPSTITGQQGALTPIQDTTPPSSAPSTGVSAPLSPSSTQGPQGGGVDLVKDRGTPDQALKQMDPDMLTRTAEQSMKAVSSASGETGKHSDTPSKKKQANDLLKAQGGDPQKAFNQMKKGIYDSLQEKRKAGDITSEHHDSLKSRWKNVFSIVPKEDFGLFLMDFGMRAMMASETMGSMAAIGAAGSGALQASQARRQSKVDDSLEDQETAHKQAMEQTAITRPKATGALSTKVESTESGLIERRPDGTWGPLMVDGKQAKRDSASSQGYRGKEYWLAMRYKRDGIDDTTINELISGARTAAERSQVLQDQLGKLKTGSFTAKDANGKKFRDYTSKDDAAWIARQMSVADEATQEYALNKALSKY